MQITCLETWRFDIPLFFLFFHEYRSISIDTVDNFETKYMEINISYQGENWVLQKPSI